MYDKVRVKKSQIFEVNQDTSQKETKTEETGRVSHLGAAHTYCSGRAGFVWSSVELGCIQGLWGLFCTRFLEII